ncbi:MAG: S-layer homology domain-containing protein [Clostridia bacterium]|nr:S-layer homology domain-containing protein [Clostridia bacterium]
MRKILSFVLSIVLVFGLVDAVWATDAENELITVYLSVSENGEFVSSSISEEKMVDIPIEISYFDLADYGLEEYYRYEADSFENGGAYINDTVVEKPTLMHLFIKAVEEYCLGETYDSEKHNETLDFTGTATSAYASRFWNHDSNFTYLVDGKMPEIKAGWGASCDYILLEDGMHIEIGMFSSWNWATSGSVASFEDKELKAFSGGTVDFSVSGNPLFYGGSEPIDLDAEDVFIVKSSNIDWVNDETAEYIFEADENGIFSVRFDETGEYYVSAVDVNVGTEESTIAPAVCKVTVVEAPELPEYDGYWTSFRGNQNNMGVVEAKIPKSESRAVLKWAEKYSESWMDTTTPPIIVNGDLYFAKNDRVIHASSADGELIAESEILADSIGFGTTSVTYGGGMFFVPIGNGRIQALRADTLESLWISEPMSGQTITPVTYFEGKVFCGTWNGEEETGTYFCLDIEDEDKNKKTETKKCKWKLEHTGGFYWAGVFVAESFAVFGSDDGMAEGTNGTSVLYSVNIETGEVIDKIEGISGDIRSTVSFDTETDRIYFTSKGGWFCKAAINEDGTFEDSCFEYFDLGGSSTVTPIVYDGLAYIGVSRSEQFENGGHGYLVIDVNASPMKAVAAMETPGSVQSSPLLTNAYENSGYVYVYITYNNIPGGIFELCVKKTDATDEDGAAVVELSSTEIFVPEEDMAQFCICSPVCDEDGVIYYKNDSGYYMAVKRKVSSSVSSGSGSSGGSGGSGGTVTKDEEKKEEVKEESKEELKTDVLENKTEEKPANVSFEDTKGHWAEEYIFSLAKKGIITGKSEKLFAPDDMITRAEFVSLLFRMSGEQSEKTEKFDDVETDDWYSDAVSWAVEKGIALGTTDALFSPHDNITREMAVVFVSRYLEYKGIILTATDDTAFLDDEEIAEWAKPSVSVIKSSGIISGKGNNLFMPHDNATRAETAKILLNMMDVMDRYEK